MIIKEVIRDMPGYYPNQGTLNIQIKVIFGVKSSGDEAQCWFEGKGVSF